MKQNNELKFYYKFEDENLKLELPYYFGLKCCQFIQDCVSKDWLRNNQDPIINPKQYIKSDFKQFTTENKLFHCINVLTHTKFKLQSENLNETLKINRITVLNPFGGFLDIMRYSLVDQSYKEILFLMALIIKYLKEEGVKYIEEQNLTNVYSKEYNDLIKLELKNFVNTQGYLFQLVPQLIMNFFHDLPILLESQDYQNFKKLTVFQGNFQIAKQIINIFLEFAYSRSYYGPNCFQFIIEEKDQQK